MEHIEYSIEGVFAVAIFSERSSHISLNKRRVHGGEVGTEVGLHGWSHLHAFVRSYVHHQAFLPGFQTCIFVETVSTALEEALLLREYEKSASQYLFLERPSASFPCRFYR